MARAAAVGAALWSAAGAAQERGLDLWVALRAGAGDAAIIGLVLDGALLDGRDPAMRTPLHAVAAVTGDPELIGLMVARGADPAARDARGRTPLHDAAELNPVVGIAAALAGLGAPLNARDAAGETALHAAGRAGAWRTAALLTLVGADPCARDAAGRPALGAEALERARVEAPDAYDRLREAFLGCL